MGIFFVAIFIAYHKQRKNYFSIWKRPRIIFVILLLRGVLISKIMGKSMSDMLIGIKYWFFYMLIFLSASFMWFVKKSKVKYEIWNVKFLSSIKYRLIWIVIVGFVWQGAKLIRPDFFMHIGYGPLNDFFFGQKPPIYYLTGYKWTLRRQGIFAWPNNYWYFLYFF